MQGRTALHTGASRDAYDRAYLNAGLYQYRDQLMALVRVPEAGSRPDSCSRGNIQTPLKLKAWQQELSGHPDKWFAEYICKGVQQGFRIGFHGNWTDLRSCRRNMVSAKDHPEVVQAYIAKEVQAGRLEQVVTGDREKVHCSPFGVIPKKGGVNRWRLIVDLSSPEGRSVNDGISKELSSLSYVSVDDITSRILGEGRGTLLGKMDIQQAYRNIPVHPEDRPLLGMEWEGGVYMDTALPFGLRSAPLLFSAVGDALQWIMSYRGASWLDHYIDDFVTIGGPGTAVCAENMRIMERTCSDLGMPVEPSKTEGPSTVITFLGLELDTQELRASLANWKLKRSGKKRDLLSLIGLLSHACKAIRAGRSFLRRLIDLSATTKVLNRHIRLNAAARSDLQWWWQFSTLWNGVAMMTSVNRSEPEKTIAIVSDASGSWGCGAVCGQDWFQLKWQGLGQAQQYHITAKELLPVVVATAIWGQDWQGQTVKAWCDNTAVVAIVNSGSSKDPEAMHLRRCLAFLEAKWQCHLFCEHIRGRDNTAADALSRDKLTLFRDVCPQAKEEPAAIPAAVVDVLVVSKPDWTSASWTGLWKDFSEKAWPRPPEKLTERVRSDTGSSAHY